MVDRREFLKITGAAGAGIMLSGRARGLLAAPLVLGLSDPYLQPKFAYPVPNALSKPFIFRPKGTHYDIGIWQTVQQTGLVNPVTGLPLPTTVWGYGQEGKATWPGRTIEAQSNVPVTVRWTNELYAKGKPLPHILPVDTSLHWAYSLPGYESYTLGVNGVPVVTHLHGGHTESASDGLPEFFFTPKFAITGPSWVKETYLYNNTQGAGTIWYHDHALGITRLNVYAGLAGFYIIRDAVDTGKPNNPLGLPAAPYEAAFAIQDRMFRDTGALFYPAFPGEPAYADFITGEGAVLPQDRFPDGGPTVLAEFFGDHMLVNGVIWPKMDVEPRNYRLRLLNGCDSRFLVVRFRAVAPGATTLDGAGAPIPFHVIGGDQGLAAAAVQADTLIMGPGERYDLVVNFGDPAPAGMRVVMENIGGDAPFGGDFGDALPPEDYFENRQTDRIMAFDVVLPLDVLRPDTFNPAVIAGFGGVTGAVARTRKVALFEGTDQYGRLEPLLGVAEDTLDASGATVNGTLKWHMPTTEMPVLGTTEEWEIYNNTMDAHPIHLHMVHFEVLDRQGFTADLTETQIMQDPGVWGGGFTISNVVKSGPVMPAEAVERSAKDTVTAYPGQVTRIRATFDRPGEYVWHCHILSHEDHEMMRRMTVVPPTV